MGVGGPKFGPNDKRYEKHFRAVIYNSQMPRDRHVVSYY